MTGHYRMFRGAMDHPVFGSEEFTRYQAFEWMIAEASWKPRKITVGFQGVDLQRGQLCKSVRVLAAEWKWEQTKVLRFIRRLERENMIATDIATGVQRITICNYDKYQACGEDDAASDATDAQHHRNTTATTIEEDKELKSLSPEKRPSKPESNPEFAAWYAAYPNKKDRDAAERAYGKARKKVSAEILLAAAQKFAMECAGKDKQYIKHPATWLNAGSWGNASELDLPQPTSPVSVSDIRLKTYRDTGVWQTNWGDKPDDIQPIARVA